MRSGNQESVKELENLVCSFALMMRALTEARNTLTVIAEGNCKDPQRKAKETFHKIALLTIKNDN